MIVFNAGVPRSGTVLVNAILRQLFQRAGVKIHQTNPHGAELSNLVRQLQETGKDSSETVLIHTHSWDETVAELVRGKPHITGTINYRDPRDVCVSLMRLHDHGLDHAAKLTDANFRFFLHTVKSLNLLMIPYELLVADRRSHIFQIARKVGLWPSLQVLDAIDEATSVGHHRKIMEQVQAGEVENLAVRRNLKRDLAEDRESLINDRHIQSGASGRWRQELDEAQQAELQARFEPLLKRFGYEV